MAKSGVDHVITAAGGFTARAVMELLKLLVPFIHGNIKNLTWGFKDDLKKLEKTLEKIKGVTEEAEKHQITDISVRNWLNDLRDIVYDVGDVLDDFSYLLMRNETIKRSTKVCDSISVLSNNNPLYSRIKIARKIKDINKRLKKIEENKDTFQFPIVTAPTTVIVHQGQSKINFQETASCISPEDSLIGRDNDRLEIVKLLTSVSSQSEVLPVLTIVGMGGIGKSTLAQFVCEDKSVVNCFGELIIWVYAAENFHVNRILKEIIDQVTESKKSISHDTATLQILLRELHENLNGKKFLLVLDDLWSEDIDTWRRLKGALTSAGTEGSKILVTTRKEQVASIVCGTIHPFNLKQLTKEECWFIIMKEAFAKGGAVKTQVMVKIGIQIAGKCGGLPLVARTLGSLMKQKKTVIEWESIQADAVFNIEENNSKIRSILKLSYDNLSSQLKRCFSYCCIFPKGFKIARTNLINLWMAEGFLQQSGEVNRNTMEYNGNVYFNHLLQSSFFQDVEMNNFGEVYIVKMHDLIHDLARYVLDNYECSVLKTSDDLEYNSNGRRVQVAFDADGEVPTLFWKSLAGAKKLRTIFAIQDKSPDLPIEMFLANKLLRVLNTMFRSDIRKCLASISKLRHLRYLNLTMVYSPDAEFDLSLNRAITALYHLQTLLLRFSGITKLPEDIGSLKNLRHLYLGCNFALEGLPDSITSLSNLQTLDLTECGLKCLPEKIGDLKNLKYLNLRRTKIKELPEHITGCRNLEMLDLCEGEFEALPSNIGDLRNLRCLDMSKARSIRKLPVSISGLHNLSMLSLEDCFQIEELPIAFGALNKLTFFSFVGTGIKELPESCNNGLNSLEVLRVSGKYCEFSTEVKNWMNLKHLICPGASGPRGIGRLTSLQSLENYSVSHNSIEDLRELDLLKGELNILDLPDVRGGAEEARRRRRRANLIRKENFAGNGIYRG